GSEQELQRHDVRRECAATSEPESRRLRSSERQHLGLAEPGLRPPASRRLAPQRARWWLGGHEGVLRRVRYPALHLLAARSVSRLLPGRAVVQRRLRRTRGECDRATEAFSGHALSSARLEGRRHPDDELLGWRHAGVLEQSLHARSPAEKLSPDGGA